MQGYFIRLGDQTFGPVPADELRRMAADGRVRPEHWISTDGQNWAAARDVKGLFQAAANTPQAAAPPWNVPPMPPPVKRHRPVDRFIRQRPVD